MTAPTRGAERPRRPSLAMATALLSSRLLDQRLDQGLDLLTLERRAVGSLRAGAGGRGGAETVMRASGSPNIASIASTLIGCQGRTREDGKRPPLSSRSPPRYDARSQTERQSPANDSHRPRDLADRPRRQHQHRAALATAAPGRRAARAPPPPRNHNRRHTRTRRRHPESPRTGRVRPPTGIRRRRTRRDDRRRRLTLPGLQRDIPAHSGK